MDPKVYKKFIEFIEKKVILSEKEKYPVRQIRKNIELYVFNYKEKNSGKIPTNEEIIKNSIHNKHFILEGAYCAEILGMKEKAKELFTLGLNMYQSNDFDGYQYFKSYNRAALCAKKLCLFDKASSLWYDAKEYTDPEWWEEENEVIEELGELHDNTKLLLEFNESESRNVNNSIKEKVLMYNSLNKLIKPEEILEFEEFNLENKGYFIYKKLAEGGSSKVYLAKYNKVKDVENVIKIFDINDGSASTLKKHLEHYGKDDYFERANMIQHELRKKKLDFVPVFHEFGQLQDERYFTIEEHIEGKNLSGVSKDNLEQLERIKNNSKDLYDYCKNFYLYQLADTCAIFDKLHEKLIHLNYWSFIHRDIKLENIILARTPHTNEDWRRYALTPMDKEIYIVDWHIAEKLNQDYNIIDNIHGSRYYVPPEKFLTKESSIATDMYSLGATMFAYLTGSPPFFDYYKDKSLEEFPELEIVKNKTRYEEVLNKEIDNFKKMYLPGELYEKSFIKKDYIGFENKILKSINYIAESMNNLLAYNSKSRKGFRPLISTLIDLNNFECALDFDE